MLLVRFQHGRPFCSPSFAVAACRCVHRSAQMRAAQDDLQVARGVAAVSKVISDKRARLLDGGCESLLPGTRAIAKPRSVAVSTLPADPFLNDDEKEAERKVRNAVGGSLMGLYPVYEHKRFVSGKFYGSEVISPASLRYALDEARLKAPRGGADGRACVETEDDEEADE
mmetsp:Transcript_2189/g.3732  ORF Transcript_2189/g.3732 Transcript_2189/m.3732 type:complete len:170 (-) Transcript_2189:164-673(-)